MSFRLDNDLLLTTEVTKMTDFFEIKSNAGALLFHSGNVVGRSGFMFVIQKSEWDEFFQYLKQAMMDANGDSYRERYIEFPAKYNDWENPDCVWTFNTNLYNCAVNVSQWVNGELLDVEMKGV